MRFPAQGPHPQDDVEGLDQEPYNSTEEFERFLNQPVHVDAPVASLVDQADQQAQASRWAQPAKFPDHLRLVQAIAERYEVMYCDRRDPPTSWEASRKIATHCSARGSSGPSTARSGLTLTWEGIYQSEDCLLTQRNSIAWLCKRRTTFTGTFFRRRWSSSGKYKLTSPVARCRPCTRLTVHMCKATDPRLCRQHCSLSRLDRLLSR